MMKRVLAIVFSCFVLGMMFWAVYLRGHLDGHKHVHEVELMSKVEAPKLPPVTDWQKFYVAIHAGDVNAMEWTIAIENDPDSEYRDCTLFLVDGDRWYEVESIGLWSCGGPHKKGEPYRMFILPREGFAKTLKTVPSDDAKFVVVGPGRAKLVELEIKYREPKR